MQLRTTFCFLALLAAPALTGCAAAGADDGVVPLPEGVIQQRADDIPWRAGPPGLPEGSRMAVLEGEPDGDGLFTIRLEIPAGTRLLPHWHPQPERLTVLSGQVRVGFGSRFDTRTMREFGPGSYYVNPPRVPHFVDFPEDSVVQITTEGPWALNYIEP